MEIKLTLNPKPSTFNARPLCGRWNRGAAIPQGVLRHGSACMGFYGVPPFQGNDNWCPPLFTERSAVNRGGVPMGRRGSGKVKRSELSVEGYLPLNAPPSTEQPPRRVAPLPLLASLRFANRGRHPLYRCASKHCCQLIAIR